MAHNPRIEVGTNRLIGCSCGWTCQNEDELAWHVAQMRAAADQPLTIVPSPRPEDDSRQAWRELIAESLPKDVERIDFHQHRFVPCYRCSTLPGSPSLCRGCLANRQTIDELREAMHEAFEWIAARSSDDSLLVRRLKKVLGQ